MHFAHAVAITFCCILANFAVTPALAQSFAERIAAGYEVRGFSFLPSSDKGLIIIQKGVSVLQCDFDKFLYEFRPRYKAGQL